MVKIPKNCVVPVIGIGNIETKEMSYHWLCDKEIEWLTRVINEAYEKEGQSQDLVE